MKKIKDNRTLWLIISALLLFAIYKFNEYTSNRLENERKKEKMLYSNMEKHSNEYKGKIIYKNRSKGYTGTNLIHLSSGQKISLSGSTYNYEVCNCDLIYFLHLGDSIYKPIQPPKNSEYKMPK